MKIQAISPANNYQSNSKAPTFNALWMRLGQNYLDATRYHTAVMFPLKNGKQTPVQKIYKGSPVLTFSPVDLTVEEGKDALLFLSKKQQDEKGYAAAKKLRDFVKSITTRSNKHNTLFIEENDVADVSKARKELKLADISVKITDYEKKNHLVEDAPKAEVKPLNIPTTAEELMKFLTEKSAENFM